ncbi:peptide-methionine (R)-S-oxide reductase MsrB [Cryomorphaceae bacterium 1068]|nr:peptide-methionine (R)-S-oxide reductase MsrB [Cryomorphaceae bacterium 1068]
MEYKVDKSEEDWRKELSAEEFRVLREKGTERAFTGKYNLHFKDGLYKCRACDNELFTSESKFESGCGWPSFDNQVSENAVVTKRDTTHGMIRTEILCGNCGSHLGHVFNDGPTETGLRYCVNSVSIDFDSENPRD